MILKFTVPGQPVPFQRAGANGKVRYTPKRYRVYKQLVGLVAQGAKARAKWPMDARYSLHLIAHFGDKIRRDVDNVAKSLMDGLNGIAYADDHQVDELSAKKILGATDPRLEVVVEVIE